MKARDVTDAISDAFAESGRHGINVNRRLRLLCDNGGSCIANDPAELRDEHGMAHVRGAPIDLQAQDKIERLHQPIKDRVLLEIYLPSGDLERAIRELVEHQNNRR